MGGKILCRSDPGLLRESGRGAEGGRGAGSSVLEADLYPCSEISSSGLTVSVGRRPLAALF